GGDVASSVAIGRLAQLDSETPASDIVATLEESVLEANQEILRRARDEPQLRGLGTTITAMLRAEGKFALAHIGDSRAYLLLDGETTQVTKDHTFVQRLLDEGRLTEEEAERHPQRSVLMRVLGDVDADPELDLSLRPAHPGDRWMLCSDGLSGLVSLGTIDAALTDFTDPGECAEDLIQLALKGGGPDSITCRAADRRVGGTRPPCPHCRLRSGGEGRGPHPRGARGPLRGRGLLRGGAPAPQPLARTGRADAPDRPARRGAVGRVRLVAAAVLR